MNVKRISPLGWVIVAVAVGEIFMFIPSRVQEPKPDQLISPSEASLSIIGFHAVNLTSDGQKETIDAKEAELFRKKGYVLLKQVETKIIAKGDHVIRIRANQGKYFVDSKDMEFFGDILGTSENLGYQLKTEYLKYENQKNILSTDRLVWMAGPNPMQPSIEMTGKGMTAYTKKEEVILHSEVHSKKYDVAAPSIEIDSDRANIYLPKNEAFFEDNVVVKQKDMNLFSDHFLVQYNGKNKAIDKAKASDGVRIVQGPRVATCQTAHLLNGAQKIVMTGNPEVIQGEDRVRGKIVVFYLKEQKILFDEAVGDVKNLEKRDEASSPGEK